MLIRSMILSMMCFLKGTFGEVQLATYGIIFQWAAVVYMVRLKLFLACVTAALGKEEVRESIRVLVLIIMFLNIDYL